jgi:hypothetical protein
MKRTLFVLVAVTVLVSFVSFAQNAPKFQVDPMWPKPLPNHWILGSVTGSWWIAKITSGLSSGRQL